MWSNISSVWKGLFPSSLQENNCIKLEKDSGSPLMRYKHAICSTTNGFIYIHGGRHGNSPVDDDVWRFDAHQNTWLQLETTGCKPPSLQDHTLVGHGDFLYLFGGQLSASNENSFWRLNLANEAHEWQSLSVKNTKYGAHLGPKSRRGHSAVIYNDSMYIFGGFEDFRGSSAQLWEYDLVNNRWELRNLSSSSACHPEPRHSHSAIVHQDLMYIYGGLSDLKPMNDLWCWSWKEKRWFKLKTKGNSPGYLHGHSAIQAFGSMFVFGGERNGRTTRSLWRLNLSNLSWHKIKSKGPKPMPMIWHGAIANPLDILDEANYIVEGGVDDPKVFLKNSQASIDAEYHNNSTEDELPQETIPVITSPTPAPRPRIPEISSKHNKSLQLKHSRSNCVDIMSGIANGNMEKAQSRKKRSDRFSFLKRRQSSRPKSMNYELKQIPTSSSDFNFKYTSQTILEPSNLKRDLQSERNPDEDQPPKGTMQTDTNKIFDNLQTDINQMFESIGENEGCLISNQSALKNSESQLTTSRTYQTAVQNQASNLTLNAEINTTIPNSQRTSYAYITPPSEANTIQESPSPTEEKTLIKQVQTKLENNQLKCRQILLNSSKRQSTVYDRRNRRPKSEIVQSLIDRADAGIKNIYSPYFNTNHSTNSNHDTASTFKNSISFNRIHQKSNQKRTENPHIYSLDRPKRHTIHQTTTFYNLYFSEDKSSSSPTTSDNNSNEASQSKTANNDDDFEEDEEEAIFDNEITNMRMVRDDYSSITIKGHESGRYTSGNLVGVRGASGSSSRADQSSLSLETVTSDSKTLCNDITPTQQDSSIPSYVSTIPNALTVGSSRKILSDDQAQMDDESKNLGDDTSLSFSVIAEFEEDDILQYTSPTRHIHSPNQYYDDGFKSDKDIKDEPCHSQDRYDQDQPDVKHLLAHKSASSGYDSMSASYENGKSNNRSNNSNQNAYHPESDSSLRTDSSLGFSEPSETSLQQTNTKRAEKASIFKRRKGRDKAEMLSTTTDSLAITSDVNFDLSPTNNYPANGINQKPPTKSLPSSPPSSRQWMTIGANISQKKLPLITRLTGKQRSKNRYWQLCMFVIGGKQGGSHGVDEPVTIWRLYI